LPLGKNSKGRHLRIEVIVLLDLPDGSTVTLRALYDSGAELNLINHDVVITHQLRKMASRDHLQAGFLDDKELKLLGAHELTLRCSDDEGIEKSISPQKF
jgi:hypothetical protein